MQLCTLLLSSRLLTPSACLSAVLPHCLSLSVSGQYAYGMWSACSVSCGGGTQTRQQNCVSSTGTVYPDNTRCGGSAPQPTQQTCALDACPTYSRKASAFSECSVGCGSGVRTATVQCVSSTGVTVTDSLCTAATKPASSATCTQPTSCYEWRTSVWSACTVDCGSGTQTSQVQCVQSASAPQPGAAVADALCASAGAKPSSTRTCGTGGCPTFWKQSGLGPCTVSCGGGIATQTVTCTQTQNGAQSTVADAYCTAAPKPVSTQACNQQACTNGEKCTHTHSGIQARVRLHTPLCLADRCCAAVSPCR